MKRMKRLGTFAVAFLLAAMLGACGGPSSEANTTTEQSSASSAQQNSSSEPSTYAEPSQESEPSQEDVSEPSDAEVSEPSQGDAEVLRIGAADIGFCEVPASWTVLEEGISSLKYANDEVTQVVTLSLFDMSVVPADQIETFTVDDAAQSVLVALESEGASNISFATEALAGYNARVISGSYPDGVDLVAWVFTDEVGVIHYLSIEGDSDSINTLKSNFEASFSLVG